MQKLKRYIKIKNSLLLFLCSFYILFIIFSFPALAQTSTPKATATPKVTPTATPSAAPIQDSSTSSAVRDKVRQAIENLSHKPKAVIGNLDQVSDSTLQIKLEDGKLIQVATTQDTTYSRVSKTKRTDIKFNDLTIGDFTVALGFKNGNDVLEAKRVISYEAEPANNNKVFFATVTELFKGNFTVSTKAGETWTVETKNATTLGKVSSTKDINPGDQIIITGTPVDKKGLPAGRQGNTIDADKLFVLGIATSASESSPKATPKPTPSGTPKATSTPKPTATPGQNL